MKLPRQFVNLVGAVVMVAILVLGVTLIAVPLYGNSQKIDSSTRDVKQTNDLYAIQVAQLSAADERIDEIVADVVTLQSQITPILKMDDVIALAVAAAAANDASIESFTVGEIEEWMPRPGVAADDATSRATAEDPVAPVESEEVASDDSAPAADEGAATEGAGAEAAAAPPAGEEEESPQRRIPVTIEVKVDSAARAAAFMDALGRGPRLLVPTSGVLDDGKLVVTAYALMRTGD